MQVDALHKTQIQLENLQSLRNRLVNDATLLEVVESTVQALSETGVIS